jgi:hypothetical protein
MLSEGPPAEAAKANASCARAKLATRSAADAAAPHAQVAELKIA